jgi:selenocysteine lyase/cysteine desulfurase
MPFAEIPHPDAPQQPPRRLESFDAAFSRTLFPAFSAELPPRWIFLDNAGGTYPCGAVVERLLRFYGENKVQPYGANALAARAGEQMDEGRRVISELLDVPQETLTLGPSTTQNLNTLAQACRPLAGPGQEIIISEQEHEANAGCWERLARETGATVKFWPVNPESGELDPVHLKQELTGRTRLVCVTHSSNIVGTINPIAEYAREAHEVGARLVVDAVSYAPHCWPQIGSTGADAYCFSTYKTFGTHIGVLWTDPGFLEELEPQCHFFNVKKPWLRLDAAGPLHGSIAALAGLADFIRALHSHHFAESDASLCELAADVSTLVQEHEARMCEALLDGLAGLPVRVVGKLRSEGREANISFSSGAISSAELATRLAEHGVAAKNGHFYAARLVRHLGYPDPDDGVLRLSFALYNTEEETHRVVEALGRVLGT